MLTEIALESSGGWGVASFGIKIVLDNIQAGGQLLTPYNGIDGSCVRTVYPSCTLVRSWWHTHRGSDGSTDATRCGWPPRVVNGCLLDAASLYVDDRLRKDRPHQLWRPVVIYAAPSRMVLLQWDRCRFQCCCVVAYSCFLASLWLTSACPWFRLLGPDVGVCRNPQKYSERDWKGAPLLSEAKTTSTMPLYLVYRRL